LGWRLLFRQADTRTLIRSYTEVKRARRNVLADLVGDIQQNGLAHVLWGSKPVYWLSDAQYALLKDAASLDDYETEAVRAFLLGICRLEEQ
jgi:hypothetical protein